MENYKLQCLSFFRQMIQFHNGTQNENDLNHRFRTYNFDILVSSEWWLVHCQNEFLNAINTNEMYRPQDE